MHNLEKDLLKRIVIITIVITVFTIVIITIVTNIITIITRGAKTFSVSPQMFTHIYRVSGGYSFWHPVKRLANGLRERPRSRFLPA